MVKPDLNHIVCFDNGFSSLPLVVELAKRSNFTSGTIRSNRASGCSFLTDVDMRKRGRKAFEEKGTSVDGVKVRIVKWYDIRAVQLASSCCGVQTLSSVERWDRSKKQRVSINCPAIVDMYNNSIGNVDAVDALISYYRIHSKSKKYYLRIFFHLMDLCVVNAWLLYRRDCKSFDVPQNRQKGLLAFRVSIADALCKHNKDFLPVLRWQPSRKQRRDTLGGAQTSLTRSRSPRAPHPYEKTRKDGCCH